LADLGQLDEANTVARWPFFRPNNTKQAGKKYFWPQKIGGRTATNFSEKWLKTGRKKFRPVFRYKKMGGRLCTKRRKK
jgi:hypothetical protein